jgi:hypothetical protein
MDSIKQIKTVKYCINYIELPDGEGYSLVDIRSTDDKIAPNFGTVDFNSFFTQFLALEPVQQILPWKVAQICPAYVMMLKERGEQLGFGWGKKGESFCWR